MTKRFARRAVSALALTVLPGGLLFATGIDPWDSGLQTVLKTLEGPTATIIGALCIVGGGILLAVTEGQAIKRLFWVVIGLGVALNATHLVPLLFAGTTDPLSVSGFLVWAGGAIRTAGAAVAMALSEGARAAAGLLTAALSGAGHAVASLATTAGGSPWSLS